MAATKILDWSIYVLKCPRTRAVRYVGFTSQRPERRLQHHLSDALKSPRENYRHSWIMSLVSIGLMPVMEVIERGTGDGWADVERRWIASYRARSARLVNGTDGGDGVIGWGTPEQRHEIGKKRRATQIANTTPEQRSAIAAKGRAGMSPEARRAAAKLGKANMTPEQRSAAARKAIAGKTPDQRREAGLKSAAAVTPEKRHNANRKAVESRATIWARLTPKERNQRILAMRKANATRTPEERVESARNARTAWLDQSTHEERSEMIRRNWAAKTPEARAGIAKRRWAAMTAERRKEIGAAISAAKRRS
jgi:hypothetical protein